MSTTIFHDHLPLEDIVQWLNEGKVLRVVPHGLLMLCTPPVYMWKVDNNSVRVVKDWRCAYKPIDDFDKPDIVMFFEWNAPVALAEINHGDYSSAQVVPKEEVPALMQMFKKYIKDF